MTDTTTPPSGGPTTNGQEAVRPSRDRPRAAPGCPASQDPPPDDEGQRAPEADETERRAEEGELRPSERLPTLLGWAEVCARFGCRGAPSAAGEGGLAPPLEAPRVVGGHGGDGRGAPHRDRDRQGLPAGAVRGLIACQRPETAHPVRQARQSSRTGWETSRRSGRASSGGCSPESALAATRISLGASPIVACEAESLGGPRVPSAAVRATASEIGSGARGEAARRTSHTTARMDPHPVSRASARRRRRHSRDARVPGRAHRAEGDAWAGQRPVRVDR